MVKKRSAALLTHLIYSHNPKYTIHLNRQLFKTPEELNTIPIILLQFYKIHISQISTLLKQKSKSIQRCRT